LGRVWGQLRLLCLGILKGIKVIADKDMGLKPYYQDEWVTIYLGDCRGILPQLPRVDLVLTDPPYPDQHPEYQFIDISFLDKLECRQLVFWSPKFEFPLDYTAIHIWDKYPQLQEDSCIVAYERIFERNGKANYRMFRGFRIGNKVRAMRSADIFTGHPSQKPRYLIEKLIIYASKPNQLILDPLIGSGTTAYCAKKLNRRCIGIEIEERYCEIAAKRCSQGVFDLSG